MPEIEKETTKQEQRSKLVAVGVILTVLFAAVSGLLAMACGTGDIGFNVFLSYFQKPVLLAFNIVPVVLLSLVLYMIFGRPWIAFLLGSFAALSAGVLQGLKVIIAKDVFYVSDVLGADPLDFLPGLSSVALTPFMILSFVWLVFGTVLLVRIFRKRKAPRLRARLTAALIFALLFVPYFIGALSDTLHADLTDNSAAVNADSETEVYVSKGFIYPFVRTLKGGSQAPGGYSEASAKTLLEGLSDSAIPKDKAVNVIVVQLEAFADFSKIKLNGVDTSAVYEGYSAFASQGISGTLYTGFYGNDDAEAGRAVLSGCSKPLNLRGVSNSYVRYFAQQGYSCRGICLDEFYKLSRGRINKSLGFESFEYASGEALESSASYNSDIKLFADGLEQLKKGIAESDKPLFLYWESCSASDYSSRSLYDDITDGHFDLGSANIINNYFGRLKESLFSLSGCLNAIEELDAPVVVLIYGDAKPDLGSSVYAAMGVNDSLSEFKNSTDYLIWANSVASEKLEGSKLSMAREGGAQGETVSSNFLMATLFDACSFEGPAFMKASVRLMEKLPVVLEKGLFMMRGEDRLVTTSDVELGLQTELYNHRYLEYYWRSLGAEKQ